MPILRLTLLPCRFAIITILAALALAQAPVATAANIFVAKLNFGTSSEDLREAFEAFGAVSSAKVITDSATGRSKGYGFVEMPDDQEAQAAIDALNETDFDGRTIVVKRAEPRESAGAGSGRRPTGGFGSGGSVRPAGGLGGGGLGPQAGLDSSPKPPTPAPAPTPTPTPTPTVADVPAVGDAAADETSSSEAFDDAEVDAELDVLDADAADEAMEDGEAELDASEDFTGEEEESDSDASMEVDAADSDESAEVDDAQVDESIDAADETDESGDERA